MGLVLMPPVEVSVVDGWVAPEVLVLADHPEGMTALRSGLEEQGYSVVVGSREEAVPAHPALESVTVVLIEVEDITGLQLEAIRALAGAAPSERRVVVVGEGNVADRVRLLNAGADLCLPRGLSGDEQLARVLAVIRQAGLHGRRLTLREGSLTVDLARRAAAYRGRRLSLSPAEYRSLRELALRVVENRSRFPGPDGDDRLTMAIRRLCDFAERLEENTQSRMLDRAHLHVEAAESRRAKA